MASNGKRYKGRLAAALGVAVVVLLVQVTGGVITGSLALLADAGHLLTDVVGVGLALAAVTYANRPAPAHRTYGNFRVEILAALVNGVLLLVVATFVVVQAVQRWYDPSEVEAGPMLAIAVFGLVGNLISLGLLHAGQAENLNVRGAYLEVLGDLVGSAVVIVAALVIWTTGWLRADVVASLLIAAFIIPRAIGLLRTTGHVLLESTPPGIDLDEIRRHITALPGVVDVHDLHVWTITSGMPVLSAHVVVEPSVLAEACDGSAVLDRLGHCLEADFDVEHCTFQLEPVTHAAHEHAAHE
ncbi:MAG TPA: cation diffusion facilitator family transporter [Candidatus Limnocylindria bacterium]|nr:cation diffusion facilitator family transporter [Candidatus Limnocylindria bacterium]